MMSPFFKEQRFGIKYDVRSYLDSLVMCAAPQLICVTLDNGNIQSHLAFDVIAVSSLSQEKRLCSTYYLLAPALIG